MSTKRTESPDASSADAAVPDFTPVCLRYRRDGWTPERQRNYVAALAETGHAGKAARAVGMTEQSAAKLRRRPGAESFNAACADAYLGARRRWAMASLAARGGFGRFDFLIPMAPRPLGPFETSAAPPFPEGRR